ncbi:Exocyst complex component sec15 [Colletotrichum spinosum]|uniref:Exocyst complex component sec15 n=1 Tax=Colletotrichum spinosum TaxID=1347390 RepID=A0A4V3HQV2_9PEZI|nr:Exocyst complex component sec15 [Colletotrichum spinosum]
MPRRPQTYDDYHVAVQQIILASSDPDFLDQLIPVLKDATKSNRTSSLTQNLNRYAEEREIDIERIGLTQHEEFLGSVNQLQSVREGTVALTAEILSLNQSIQASTKKLADQKQSLVNTRAVRQNIADASDALEESLKILHAVNHAHDLIRQKQYYAALKSLDDLQNEHLIPTIQNVYATQHQLADLIQMSIPLSQKTISEAVMSDLNTWLFRIRETSQFLGEVAFYHTELRRTRQRDRVDRDGFLNNFKLNSSIELVFDESEEFDVLDNEELQVEFKPLFECLHIQSALGQSEKFRAEYAATRRQQKDLLLPSSVGLATDDESSLSSLLESIAGFAIIERATMCRVPHLRSAVDILINLEHFEAACQELEQLLIRARSSTSAGGPVTLVATEEFRNNKKTAEKRIFELVNSKIDDLVDTAEYDWMAPTNTLDPSSYMQTMTRYLSNIMNSTLLGLPREIKELIYFDALSHAANKILALPLSTEVKHINNNAVAALAQDVQYLTEFVDSLENSAMLRENLDELQQTINLMQSDNHDEFFDISIRNKKFGRVDALNGPILLEKLTSSSQGPSRSAPLVNFSSRFGMK